MCLYYIWLARGGLPLVRPNNGRPPATSNGLEKNQLTSTNRALGPWGPERSETKVNKVQQTKNSKWHKKHNTLLCFLFSSLCLCLFLLLVNFCGVFFYRKLSLFCLKMRHSSYNFHLWVGISVKNTKKRKKRMPVPSGVCFSSFPVFLEWLRRDLEATKRTMCRGKQKQHWRGGVLVMKTPLVVQALCDCCCSTYLLNHSHRSTTPL